MCDKKKVYIVDAYNDIPYGEYMGIMVAKKQCKKYVLN